MMRACHAGTKRKFSIDGKISKWAIIADVIF